MSTIGDKLKQKGQDQVWRKTSVDWRDKALEELRRFAKTRPTFDACDFRVHCVDYDIGQPEHQNAWGALFRVAASDGIICKTGKYKKSAWPSAHSHYYAVWRRA